MVYLGSIGIISNSWTTCSSIWSAKLSKICLLLHFPTMLME